MNAKMNVRMNFVLMNDLLNGPYLYNPKIKTNFSISWKYVCERLRQATFKLIFLPNQVSCLGDAIGVKQIWEAAHPRRLHSSVNNLMKPYPSLLELVSNNQTLLVIIKDGISESRCSLPHGRVAPVCNIQYNN